MDKRWSRLGLAAVIALAPGGFVLGAALGARYLREQAAKRAAESRDGATKSGDDT